MKLILSQFDLDSTPALFLRTAGYTYIESYHTGKGSFARPLGGGHYPRFHVYVEEEDEKIVINLHLDQKQASYEGTSAHSGEYDGELVDQEIRRLKTFIRPSGLSKKKSSPNNAPTNDARSQRFSNMLRNM
jgi:hypothetical protein